MKRYLFVCFSIVIAFLIVCGVFYIVNSRPDTEEAKKEEQLRSLDKQISIYRSDDQDAYQVLEKLYSDKGDVYLHYEEYPEAYNCYREAIRFAQENNNQRNMAKLAWLMIRLAKEQKQSALVLTLSKKYQKLIIQRDIDIFNFYYLWGMACLAENQNEAALKILSKGLKYLNSETQFDLSGERVLIYFALSTVYVRKKDFHNCEKYLNKANKLLADSSYIIRPGNDIYSGLKSALMEIEKTKPPRSVALGETYRRLAECYRYKDPENYRKNMLKAIKMYPVASPQIGEVYFKLGEFFYKNQKYYFDKCVPALAGVKSNSAAKMLLSIALTTPDEYPDKSLQLLQLALQALPDPNKDPSITARIFQRFAYCYSAKKDWQKAATYAEKSFGFAKKINKIKLSFEFVLGCYEHIDNLYKSQKKIKKRIKNAEDAVAFMTSNEGNLFYLNKAYDKLGKIYKLDKRYSDAEKCYRKIIKIFAKNSSKRENLLDLRQEINAYCKIGDLCLLQRAPQRAEKAFAAASNLLKRKTVDELAEWYFAEVCLNIADGYYYLHKDVLSEEYYKKLLALLLAKDTKDNRAIAYVYYRIGKIALGQKKLQISQDYFKKGLKYALTAYEEQKNKYGHNFTTGMCAADIGAFYDKLKQKDKALEFLRIAHQLLKKYGENQPELAERISQHIKKLE